MTVTIASISFSVNVSSSTWHPLLAPSSGRLSILQRDISRYKLDVNHERPFLLLAITWHSRDYYILQTTRSNNFRLVVYVIERYFTVFNILFREFLSLLTDNFAYIYLFVLFDLFNQFNYDFRIKIVHVFIVQYISIYIVCLFYWLFLHVFTLKEINHMFWINSFQDIFLSINVHANHVECHKTELPETEKDRIAIYNFLTNDTALSIIQWIKIIIHVDVCL